MHAATPTRRSGEEFERRTRGTVIVSSSSMLSRLGAESRRCDISAMADPKAEPRPFRKSHPGACELGALANFWAPPAREAPILAMPRLAWPLHLEAVKETCETHCAITTLHIRLARPSSELPRGRRGADRRALPRLHTTNGAPPPDRRASPRGRSHAIRRPVPCHTRHRYERMAPAIGTHYFSVPANRTLPTVTMSW